MRKTGVLIINLGTPDSPKVKDVRRYLFEFLNDKRVIDLPLLGRKLLVNGIIVPFRAPKSAKAYQELFDMFNNESPLMSYGVSLSEKLQNQLGENYHVELAMRYQNPSMEQAIQNLKKLNLKEIIVVPLYPQHASSTTGSTIERFNLLINNWWQIPNVTYINEFYTHPAFIDSFVKQGEKFKWQDYDHVLFSYHGLPVRHLEKAKPNGRAACDNCTCDNGVDETNYFCYKAQCVETTKLIAEKLNIPKDKFSTAFQSRLGRAEWIKPYTEDTVIELAESGKKNVLVFCPAFVADCLETVIEIGDEYQEVFEEHGGEKLELVTSLNDEQHWVENLAKIVQDFEH